MSVVIFTAITYETLPVGLLLPIADDLGVTEQRAGLLTGAYAAVVVAGAIPLSIATTRLHVRTALLIELAVFAVSATMVSLSSTFWVALVARIIGGLAHAVVFTSTFRLTLAVVAVERRARALALLSAGNGLALALGVPAATSLGAATQWRLPFAVLAAAFVLLALATTLVVPRLLPDVESTLPNGQLLAAIRRGPLLRVGLSVVLVCAAHYSSYTYIAPIALRAGASTSQIDDLLLGYGIASLLALIVVSRLADQHPRLLMYATMALLALSFAALLLAVTAHTLALAVAATITWGAAMGAFPILSQLLAVRASPQMPSAASPIVNTNFNVGIFTGALAGGRLLATVGVPGILLTSAACSVAVLALTSLPRWFPRPPAQPPTQPATRPPSTTGPQPG